MHSAYRREKLKIDQQRRDSDPRPRVVVAWLEWCHSLHDGERFAEVERGAAEAQAAALEGATDAPTAPA